MFKLASALRKTASEIKRTASYVNFNVIKYAAADVVSFLMSLKADLMPGNAAKIDKLIADLNSGATTPDLATREVASIISQDDDLKMADTMDAMSHLTNQPDKITGKPVDINNIADPATQDPDYNVPGVVKEFSSKLDKEFLKIADDGPMDLSNPQKVTEFVAKRREKAKLEDQLKAMGL